MMRTIVEPIDMRAQSRELPIAFFTSANQPEVVEQTSPFGPVFTKPDELDAALDWLERHGRG